MFVFKLIFLRVTLKRVTTPMHHHSPPPTHKKCPRTPTYPIYLHHPPTHLQPPIKTVNAPLSTENTPPPTPTHPYPPKIKCSRTAFSTTVPLLAPIKENRVCD